jgi:hypothetical protein
VFQSSYTDKKTGKLRKSARWHVEFWVNGKPQREKTGSVLSVVYGYFLPKESLEFC